MTMDLQAPLGDNLDDFLHCEFVRVLHQAAELEAALKLHQTRMKDVCHSIKAHEHWVTCGEHFPFTLHCKQCGDAISPEFDRRRHRGPLHSEGVAIDYRLLLTLSIELSKHVLPLLYVFRHRALWNLQPEVVQNVLLFFRLHDLPQDLVSHKRHRDSLGQLFFNGLEELIGFCYCLTGQGVPVF